MTFNFGDLTEDLNRAYSPRVALRPVCLADGWPLFAATRNPLFNEHIAWSQPKDEMMALDRISKISAAVAQEKMSAVSVVLRSTGEWIGLFRYMPYNNQDKTLEVGLWASDKFWTGRFGREIGQLCINAAFRLSGVERIVGIATQGNRSSRSNMLAGGMRPGEAFSRKVEDGRVFPVQEFLVDRKDWEKIGPSPYLSIYGEETREEPEHEFGFNWFPSSGVAIA